MTSGTQGIRLADGAEPELLPALDIDLRRAVRLGLLSGIALVFVSAVGMVVSFQDRDILRGLSLGYVLLLLVSSGVAYLAARPPPQLEGFAPTRLGVRSVIAGLIAGSVSSAVLGAFVLVAGNINLRGIFLNVSPELIDLLTLERGLFAGIVLIVVAGGLLGGVGGGLTLLGRWQTSLIAAFAWVLLFGLMRSVVGQVLRGVGVGRLTDFLYEPAGGLSPAGAAAVGGFFLALNLRFARRRSTVREAIRRIPEHRRRSITLVGLVVSAVVIAILPRVLGSFLTEVMNVAGIFLLMALGLNIVVGFAGLLDLGYVAFFAVGAYTAAVLTSPVSPGISPELAFWAAIPFVILAAAASGILVGTPVLRMRGDYLAIVTLGFGEIARILFLSDALKGNFGGAQGIINIPDPNIGAVAIHGPQAFFYAIFAFVLLAGYTSYALQDSRIGRAWMAMREDESVAEAMGVNIVQAKLWAFIIGAILASFGGALFATKIGSVFPHSFNIIVSFTVLVVIIVGGLGSMPGVVAGALVMVALPELLREFEEFKFLIYGVLLIFMMLKRPEGFIPSRRRARELRQEEFDQDTWLREEREQQEGGSRLPAPETG